jgi:hypothetical protein
MTAFLSRVCSVSRAFDLFIYMLDLKINSIPL